MGADIVDEAKERFEAHGVRVRLAEGLSDPPFAEKSRVVTGIHHQMPKRAVIGPDIDMITVERTHPAVLTGQQRDARRRTDRIARIGGGQDRAR